MTELNRKDLKGPDQFESKVKPMFNDMRKHAKTWIAAAVVILAVGLAYGIYDSQKKAFENEGSEALFIASKSLDKKFVELAKKSLGKEEPSKKPDLNGMPDPDLDEIAFVRIDVQSSLSSEIEALKKVSEKYHGSRAGFEADLKLGDLFFDHALQGSDEALKWYQSALDQANSTLDKSFAAYAQAHALEAHGKFEEAIKTLETVMHEAPESFEPELMMTLARVEQKSGNTARASELYDEIQIKHQNTDFARRASALKKRL